jgi:hypothetical protein
MFSPKTKWQFLAYILLFFIMLGLIPLINFCLIAVLVMVVLLDRLGLKNFLLNCKRRGCWTKILLFFFFLPWNAFLLSLVLIFGVIAGGLALPLMVIPSYYVNIRSYYEIMHYWWSGNRFAPLKDESNKQEESNATSNNRNRFPLMSNRASNRELLVPPDLEPYEI